MKRRGFLAALGFGGSAVAAGVAISSPPKDVGIFIPLKCGCKDDWQLFIDLTKPIALGAPQCPNCLQVMAWPDDAAQRIKQWHLAQGNETTIYTPRHR